MSRSFVTAILTGMAALAFTTLPPALGDFTSGYLSTTAQAAENHNSSRSNRGQTSKEGTPGGSTASQAVARSVGGQGSKGTARPGNLGNSMDVGIKEEGVK